MSLATTRSLYKHPRPHKELWRRWHICLTKDDQFILSVFIAIVVFFVSIFASYYAGIYATEQASNAVTDIILSNIPVFNVTGLFLWGTFAEMIIVAIILLTGPERIPYILKTASLFLIIRSVFIVLTHIGPFPVETNPTTHELINEFMFGADRFFSGHTGLPFLGALVFWPNKPLRYFFLASSFFFGAIVLMGHLHYSIDVFSAFFITYTIYSISLWLFPKDRRLFLRNL